MRTVDKGFLERYKGLYLEEGFVKLHSPSLSYETHDIVFFKVQSTEEEERFYLIRNIFGERGLCGPEYLESMIMQAFCFRRFRGSRFGYDILLINERRL